MATWSQLFTTANPPSLAQMRDFIANPLWQELCSFLEETYDVAPTMAHSICSGAPGWNVKYRKGSRALCTLYPADGYFTCLVSIGRKEAPEAEALLAGCTDAVRTLYWQCKPFNSSRWLMIDVRSPEILADAKALIGTRCKR